jgi:DNA polymerase-3 subunit gamma/tau
MREVADRLQMIVEHEGVEADREALELVARQGTGSVRDSISLLDQLIADPSQRITLELAEQTLGTASNRATGKLVQAIIDNNVAEGLDVLNQAIDEGADPAQFGRQIVEYLRNLILVQMAGPSLVDASAEMRATLQEQAAAIGRAALLRAIRAFNAAIGEIRGGWQPQLPLEMALIESTRPLHEEVPSPAEVSVAPARASRAAKLAVPDEPGTEAPPPSATAAALLSLADIKRAWPSILETARQRNMPLAKLLDLVSVRALEGQTIVLSISEDKAVFREHLEAEDKRKELARTIQAVFGVPLHIKIVVGGTKAATGKASSDPVLSFVENELGGTVANIEDTQGGTDV